MGRTLIILLLVGMFSSYFLLEDQEKFAEKEIRKLGEERGIESIRTHFWLRIRSLLMCYAFSGSAFLLILYHIVCTQKYELYEIEGEFILLIIAVNSLFVVRNLVEKTPSVLKAQVNHTKQLKKREGKAISPSGVWAVFCCIYS